MTTLVSSILSAQMTSWQGDLLSIVCVCRCCLAMVNDAARTASAGEPLSRWCANHQNFGKAEDPNETRAVFVVRLPSGVAPRLTVRR